MVNRVNADTRPEKVVGLISKKLDFRTNLIESFTVSTDSVVATARFKLGKDAKSYQVDWGDHQYSSGHIRLNQVSHNGLSGVSEDGSLTLTHVYAEPEVKAAFSMLIVLKVRSSSGDLDFMPVEVTVVPRYKVIHTPINLFRNENSEFFIPAGDDDEYYITLNSLTPGHVFNQKWEFTYDFLAGGDWGPLGGSGLSHELVPGESFEYRFEVQELDPLWNDNLFSSRITVDLAEPTGKISYDRYYVSVFYHKYIGLIRPMPPYDGPVIGE